MSNLMNFLNLMKKAMAGGYLYESRKLKNQENNNKFNVTNFHNSNHETLSKVHYFKVSLMS